MSAVPADARRRRAFRLAALATGLNGPDMRVAWRSYRAHLRDGRLLPVRGLRAGIAFVLAVLIAERPALACAGALALLAVGPALLRHLLRG